MIVRTPKQLPAPVLALTRSFPIVAEAVGTAGSTANLTTPEEEKWTAEYEQSPA